MEKILKECKAHGETFHYYFIEKSGAKRYRCNKCNVIAVTKRRHKLKQLAVEYKGGKCERCGYSKCVRSLAFHHKDPTQKDFGLGGRGIIRSWKKVQKELDKCVLVCNNCHGEIHEELEDEVVTTQKDGA